MMLRYPFPSEFSCKLPVFPLHLIFFSLLVGWWFSFSWTTSWRRWGDLTKFRTSWPLSRYFWVIASSHKHLAIQILNFTLSVSYESRIEFCFHLHWSKYFLGSIPSCPAEDMFLCRLLLRDSIEVRHDEQIVKYVKEALTSRHASTMELFKYLEDILDTQREKTANIVSAWNVEQSPEG